MEETAARDISDQAEESGADRSGSVIQGESGLFPGDHICVKRKGRFYTHHGIYLGDRRVIHFSGSIREKVDPKVRETDLSTFLRGGKVRRRNHRERLAPSETVRIARDLLSKGKYSMIWNNCEHFATYCATGKKKSLQVRKVLSGIGTVAAGVAVVVVSRAVSATSRRA